VRRDPTKPLFAPPRIKPKATRNYAKSNYQAGGSVAVGPGPIGPPLPPMESGIPGPIKGIPKIPRALVPGAPVRQLPRLLRPGEPVNLLPRLFGDDEED